MNDKEIANRVHTLIHSLHKKDKATDEDVRVIEMLITQVLVDLHTVAEAAKELAAVTKATAFSRK